MNWVPGCVTSEIAGQAGKNAKLGDAKYIPFSAIFVAIGADLKTRQYLNVIFRFSACSGSDLEYR